MTPAPNEGESVPILPLSGSVLFPTSSMTIHVRGPRGMRLAEELLRSQRGRALVGVLSQRSPEADQPTFEELYSVGTIATVVDLARLGDKVYSLVLSGFSRFRMKSVIRLEPYLCANVERIPESTTRDAEIDALGEELRVGPRALRAAGRAPVCQGGH